MKKVKKNSKVTVQSKNNKSFTVALIGNPNCGKSTLFTALTGIYQKVGNWTGVTVERKQGKYIQNANVTVIDLPGLYSLTPSSKDEQAVLDFLRDTPPDVIINVVDGTSLERNLFLTTHLTTLAIPLIVAVNMADRLEDSGVKIDYGRLSKEFGVHFLPVSALKNKNVEALMTTASNAINEPINVITIRALSSPEDVYAFIQKVLEGALVKNLTRAERFTLKADKVLTHKIWGLPIFILVLILVYYLSSSLGGLLGALIESAFDGVNGAISRRLTAWDTPEWLIGLICGAIINGFSGVIAFLPQILMLFVLLGVIEQCGYMARVCFITDRLLRRIGLGGKSLIPLTLSCGCTVTGLMATRTIEDDLERQTTVYLSPFMPCGAKMVVFGWFSQVFFKGNPFVSVSLYFLSVAVVILGGLLLKKINSADTGAFILEMPSLCLPTFKGVWAVVKDKIKEFLVKAGTIIFTLSVVLWLLMNFGVQCYTYGKIEESFLCAIGSALKYLFVPLGFGNWQASVAVVSGVMAKEAVIETLKIVSSNPALLFDNNFSAYAFMAFVLLSCPCVASVAEARRELGSRRKVIAMIIIETLIAYSVALVINTFGYAYIGYKNLLFASILVIIILITFVFAVKRLLRRKCVGCGGCRGRKSKCKNIKRNTTI